MEKIQSVLQDYLDDYNLTNAKDVKLVFFQDAIEHVSRYNPEEKMMLGPIRYPAYLSFFLVLLHWVDWFVQMGNYSKSGLFLLSGSQWVSQGEPVKRYFQLITSSCEVTIHSQNCDSSSICIRAFGQQCVQG